jgi:hypothetical protein
MCWWVDTWVGEDNVVSNICREIIRFHSLSWSGKRKTESKKMWGCSPPHIEGFHWTSVGIRIPAIHPALRKGSLFINISNLVLTAGVELPFSLSEVYAGTSAEWCYIDRRSSSLFWARGSVSVGIRGYLAIFHPASQLEYVFPYLAELDLDFG